MKNSTPEEKAKQKAKGIGLFAFVIVFAGGIAGMFLDWLF